MDPDRSAELVGERAGGVDVVVVAVRRDDGDSSPVPHGRGDGSVVVSRVDDEHLGVVPDDPDVVLDLEVLTVEREQRRWS